MKTKNKKYSFNQFLVKTGELRQASTNQILVNDNYNQASSFQMNEIDAPMSLSGILLSDDEEYSSSRERLTLAAKNSLAEILQREKLFVDYLNLKVATYSKPFKLLFSYRKNSDGFFQRLSVA